jgi:hypothetical protein
MKNSNDASENRSRDLLVCSAVHMGRGVSEFCTGLELFWLKATLSFETSGIA